MTTQLGSVLERTVLKEGQLFVVADRDGDIKALNLEGQGLYYRDRRHLSLFEMAISGTRLMLLSSSAELNFLSTLQFCNDLLLGADGRVLAEPRTISINRQRFMAGGMHERIELRNYNAHPVTLVLRFTCGSDFRDMFEVRGFDVGEDAAGEVEPIRVRHDGVLLAYRGRGGARRTTQITFDPPPEHIEIVNSTLKQLTRAEAPQVDQRDEGLVMPPMVAMHFEVALPPMASRTIALSVIPEAETIPAENFAEPSSPSSVEVAGARLDARADAIRDSYERWHSSSTRIETDHELFDQLLNRAALDVRLLVESFDGQLVPTAGIPWFAVPFGRDSLITSMQTLSLQPSLAAGTLRFLARCQGRQEDPQHGEAPGKILHEVRPGVTGSVEDSIFFGSIDATPLFLVGLGEYLAWSGDVGLVRELLPNAEAALRWMDDYGDPDGDGFLECTRYPGDGGLGDQGWKDSPDPINHADGRPSDQPVALAEVQAYAFAAHRHMARIYGLFGMPEKERRERAAAERMRHLFFERLAMVDEAGPFWAMGLDAHGQRIQTVTTNPGHALWVGLLRDEDARLAAERLVAEDMLSGWGVRTLSASARTFNPMSYHNGSVWPHDNALIALGMKRCGADAAARIVASEIFDAGLQFPGARLPELWCGFPRDRRHSAVPSQYPVACSPQGWAAGSVFMLLQALLGLEADALTGIVRLRPSLPLWLGQVSYRGLHVGDKKLDFDVIREGHRILVDVVDDGGLRVEARESAA